MKTEGEQKSHRRAANAAEDLPDRAAARDDSPQPGDPAAPSAVGVAPSPESSVPFRSIGFTLSTTGYAVSRRFHQLLAPLELEPREFSLLRAVSAAEGQSQQAIGERLQIPPSRMVAFIDGLEARALLERRLNPDDRRTRALHLTDAGRELLGRAFAAGVAFERDLAAELTDAEGEQLLDMLHRVGARLGLPPGVHAAHSALADQ